MGRGGGANRKGGQKRRSKMRVVSHYRKLCNENIAAVLREHQHEPREHPQQIQELDVGCPRTDAASNQTGARVSSTVSDATASVVERQGRSKENFGESKPLKERYRSIALSGLFCFGRVVPMVAPGLLESDSRE